MQLSTIIYYLIVPWLLYMFRAILSLIIRSILTVITVSDFIHMCCFRLLSWLNDQQDATEYDNLLFHCFLAVLHVSSDIIAHHQEYLNCDYSFWFHSRVVVGCCRGSATTAVDNACE
jgi:hypothetical protein